MKKLILLVSLVLILASFTTVNPVPITVYSGYAITSSGSTEVEIQFGDLSDIANVKTMIYVQVDAGNSGTIQFSVGRAINASSQPYAAGSRIPIGIINGTKNLRYKASGSGQTFSVTH